jgi:hypothetical protein
MIAGFSMCSMADVSLLPEAPLVNGLREGSQQSGSMFPSNFANKSSTLRIVRIASGVFTTSTF